MLYKLSGNGQLRDLTRSPFFLRRGENKMSTRSKIVCLLVVLIFAFTSLAVGAFAGVQTAAHDLGQSDTAYHLSNPLNGAGTSIAGHCDMSPSCSSGGGG
jgi:hypothetical protein